FWQPAAVFHRPGRQERRAPSEDARHALRRLIRHRPLYPALGIFLLWDLCPGWGTPLFFYLTNTVKLSAETFGQFLGVASAFGIAANLGYGLLCQRVPLRRLLWWTTALSVATNLTFLAIPTRSQAPLAGAMVRPGRPARWRPPRARCRSRPRPESSDHAPARQGRDGPGRASLQVSRPLTRAGTAGPISPRGSRRARRPLRRRATWRVPP